MFNFDVHDDVRLMHDATVEKDESHAGKVVERSWYNRSVSRSLLGSHLASHIERGILVAMDVDVVRSFRPFARMQKHIFPASRWEVYDPEKDYGGYKIAGV